MVTLALVSPSPVQRQRDHLYVSSTDGTTPDTRLSSCITGTYVHRAPRWHFAPSNAILPCEQGGSLSISQRQTVGCLSPSRTNTVGGPARFPPGPARHLFRGGFAADSVASGRSHGRLTGTGGVKMETQCHKQPKTPLQLLVLNPLSSGRPQP